MSNIPNILDLFRYFENGVYSRNEKDKEKQWLVQTTGAGLFVYCYSGFYKLQQGLYRRFPAIISSLNVIQS